LLFYIKAILWCSHIWNNLNMVIFGYRYSISHCNHPLYVFWKIADKEFVKTCFMIQRIIPPKSDPIVVQLIVTTDIYFLVRTWVHIKFIWYAKSLLYGCQKKIKAILPDWLTSTNLIGNYFNQQNCLLQQNFHLNCYFVVCNFCFHASNNGKINNSIYPR